ncbi:MAG: ATP-binding cassette domain-containing protein [Kineosporiaceae bacterium]
MSEPPLPLTDAPLVLARGLSLDGPRGPVFESVEVTLHQGDLLAVAGPVGSGRTCLLLTLSGRMRPSAGDLVVAGHPLPRHASAARRASGLAEIAGVNDLDPRMTVAEHLHERLALVDPWWHLGLARASRTRARATELLHRIDRLDPDPAPWDLRAPVATLTAPRRWRLGLAAALADAPSLVLVDDLDTLGDVPDVAAAWTLLRRLADTGPGVVAACTDTSRIPDGVADAVLPLTTAGAATAAGTATPRTRALA